MACSHCATCRLLSPASQWHTYHTSPCKCHPREQQYYACLVVKPQTRPFILLIGALLHSRIRSAIHLKPFLTKRLDNLGKTLASVVIQLHAVFELSELDCMLTVKACEVTNRLIFSICPVLSGHEDLLELASDQSKEATTEQCGVLLARHGHICVSIIYIQATQLAVQIFNATVVACSSLPWTVLVKSSTCRQQTAILEGVGNCLYFCRDRT